MTRLTASISFAFFAAWFLTGQVGAVQIVGFPYASYKPETSLAVGAAGRVFFRFAGTDAATRNSSVQLTLQYTFKKQSRVNLSGDLYSPKGSWRLLADNRVEAFSASFYPPPGARDVPKEYFADYDWRMFRSDIQGLRRGWGAFYAGAGTYVQDYRLRKWAGRKGYVPGGAYAPGAAGGFIVGPTGVVAYDNRDFPNATSRGWLLTARVSAFGRGAGSDFSFQWYEADARWALPLGGGGRRCTLANRVFLAGRSGAPPFWATPALGGSNLLRGEPEGRARGRWLLAYQSEFRMHWFWRLGGAVFCDVGDAGHDVADFSLDTTLLTAGAGVRFDLVKTGESVVRIDFGVGKDYTALYAVMDEAF